MENIENILRGNAYPGRGIVIGLTPDGDGSLVAYFIMGRSENSRNRVFLRTPDGIRTAAFDAAKLADPSLVIYHPVRAAGDALIVTNGDQTDTIAEYLQRGKSFHDALLTREFEPDPPIYTPRVSGIVSANGGYTLSILKTLGGDPSCCCRYFFEYAKPVAGIGHFISTYARDGSPPPSFSGEPTAVGVSGDCGEFARNIWDALNPDNRVSLYVRERNIKSGAVRDFIINRHGDM